MHRAVHRSLRFQTRLPARLIAGRRYPRAPSHRTFNSSTVTSFNFPPWPANSQESAPEQSRKDIPKELEQATSVSGPPGAPGATDGAEALAESVSNNGKEKNGTYGSAARRWQRNRRPKEIPPIVIPQWFLDGNVRLHDDEGSLTRGTLTLTDSTLAEHDVEKHELHKALKAKLTAVVNDIASLLDRDSTETPEQKAEGKKKLVEVRKKLNEKLAEATKNVAPTGLENADKTSTSDAGSSTGSSDEIHTSEDFIEDMEDSASDATSQEYHIRDVLMDEITANVSACLHSSRLEASENFPSTKAYLKLHCPVDGATFFLDHLVENAARRNDADVIRIDPQDLAEIAGEYINEGADARSNAIWTLGYDTQELVERSQSSSGHEPSAAEEEEEEMEDEDSKQMSPQFPGFSSVTAIPVMGMSGSFQDIQKLLGRMPFPSGSGQNPARSGQPRNNTPGLLPASQFQNPAQQWNDLKLTHLLESLLESNQMKKIDKDGSKQAAVSQEQQEPPASTPTVISTEDVSQVNGAPPIQASWPLPRTIVHIRSLKEMSSTSKGGYIMEKLLGLVQKKRKEGQQITIIGTTSSSELTPDFEGTSYEGIQEEGSESLYRTLFVTPHGNALHGGIFAQDETNCWYTTNCRHLRDMLRRLEVIHDDTPRDLKLPEDMSKSYRLKTALRERALTFDEVHRIALTIVGQSRLDASKAGTGLTFDGEAVLKAVDLLERSDDVKQSWESNEAALRSPKLGLKMDKKPRKSATEAKVNKIRQTADKYEKRLLNGVVHPENIRTTFNDVHAPLETTEALKNLTTLSLTRPEAFQYGVLATDKITGALLYGPPGTGKTLLAKAVAKESGATVLEVSGSDVYDMYVGEGEKNVRAIFSLAKKLSPCVVFIDEADAIFASRGGPNSRNSHRELINQFLREWDGMTDTNAFIMVATNRPFDLDDAALRRLPRRLLIDLPTEKDREAILKIHLSGEVLDPEVSIFKLATNTPLYSGSDLKNVAVAAALSAVREENDAAKAHKESGSEDPHRYPEKRVLSQRHFDKALEEITASVNEDMGSLQAIKKFDEKYGDRRGKKKKQSYGFTTGAEEKKDTVKVRS